MDYFLAMLLCLIFSGLWCFSYFFISSRTNNGHGLPPGPMGLPLLGHLHMLGDLPHRNLHKLAQKYGPIMSIRLGLVPAIVVSSSQAAELFLKTNDIVFANRPKTQAAKYFTYGQRDLSFEQYGSRWRDLRKFVTVELLTSSKIESTKSARKENVINLIKSLVKASEEHSVVDVSAKVGSLIENMAFAMILGGNKDDSRVFELKSIIEQVMILFGAFNLADYIPFVGALDLQGLSGRMKSVSKVVDEFLENILNDHVRDVKTRGNNHHTNFIDVMISFLESNSAHSEQLDRDTIKALVLDMIVGGMDSSATAIEWALSELVRDPRVMEKLQTELEKVVGMNRMVEESDLVKLEYLDLVVKESFRLHPVGPLLVPHESIKDIVINGYFIPKKTTLLVNSWAMGRDPNVWSADFAEYCPERFIGSNVDFRGYDLRFIPFGSGRRGCPAVQLGLTVVCLVVAQFVHCFNWELPNGMSPNDLDMDEKYGLTMPRANHLLAKPTFRLNMDHL